MRTACPSKHWETHWSACAQYNWSMRLFLHLSRPTMASLYQFSPAASIHQSMFASTRAAVCLKISFSSLEELTHRPSVYSVQGFTLLYLSFSYLPTTPMCQSSWAELQKVKYANSTDDNFEKLWDWLQVRSFSFNNKLFSFSFCKFQFQKICKVKTFASLNLRNVTKSRKFIV